MFELRFRPTRMGQSLISIEPKPYGTEGRTGSDSFVLGPDQIWCMYRCKSASCCALVMAELLKYDMAGVNGERDVVNLI